MARSRQAVAQAPGHRGLALAMDRPRDQDGGGSPGRDGRLDSRAQRLVGLRLDAAHQPCAPAEAAQVGNAGEHPHIEQAPQLARALHARGQLVAAQGEQNPEEERSEGGQHAVSQRARRAGRGGRLCLADDLQVAARTELGKAQLADALTKGAQLPLGRRVGLETFELGLELLAGLRDAAPLEARPLGQEGLRNGVGDCGGPARVAVTRADLNDVGFRIDLRADLVLQAIGSLARQPGRSGLQDAARSEKLLSSVELPADALRVARLKGRRILLEHDRGCRRVAVGQPERYSDDRARHDHENEQDHATAS